MYWVISKLFVWLICLILRIFVALINFVLVWIYKLKGISMLCLICQCLYWFCWGWDVLLVDMSNAFNSLNHTSMLLHVRILWPSCFCILYKCCCGWFVLVLWSSTEFLHSTGGGTQGDSVSMLMYAIKTLPLITILRHCLVYSEKLWREDSLANLLFSSIW